MKKEQRFPAEITEILKCSGWYPGRRVSVEVIEAWREERLISDGLDMPDSAKAVLEEFGQLTIGSNERGIDFARTKLCFDADGDGGSYLKNYVAAAGVGELYPLGAYGDNDGTFMIAHSGAVYVDFRLDAPAGENIDQALVNLLLGIKW